MLRRRRTVIPLAWFATFVGAGLATACGIDREMHDPKDMGLIKAMGDDPRVTSLATDLVVASAGYRYTYNFSWLGRPIIQFPEDLVALQEIVWKTKPELVVETGIAHGGSLIFYASMLELLGGDGRVLGIDIDIRSHNRTAIEAHPLAHRIEMIEGSSTAAPTIEAVYARAAGRTNMMVVLDSNHTHKHVLEELRAYAPLVRAGGYLIVLDTVVEHMPEDFYHDRPWGRGDNPMTAVDVFLSENHRFVIDEEYNNKLLLTVAPRGYLRCVANP